MDSRHCASASSAAAANCSRAGVAGLPSASQPLSRRSIAQAASPKEASPTIRPLPLRVWKARRRLVNGSVLALSASRALMAVRALSMTSAASSRKMSRRSSSSMGVSQMESTGCSATGASTEMACASPSESPAAAAVWTLESACRACWARPGCPASSACWMTLSSCRAASAGDKPPEVWALTKLSRAGTSDWFGEGEKRGVVSLNGPVGAGEKPGWEGVCTSSWFAASK